MRSIKRLKNLKGKTVLVRVDFNVPVEGKKVMDDTKLRASLPTIEYLIKQKARVVVITHLGRPKGVVKASLKLDPVAKALSNLLKKQVKKVLVSKADTEVSHMKDGQVIMLENIRFSKDEKKNTGNLARTLAELGDLFVLDGFAVAHRAAASVVGIAAYLPSYAGLLLEKEIKGLSKVLHNPKAPFVACIGGAKIETKIPVLKHFIKRADYILAGGGLVNTYLSAKGYGVGDSLVDAAYKKEALAYCSKRKVITPVDVVVGNFEGTEYRIVKVKKTKHRICKKGEMILDAGPETIQMYADHIRKAKTIVWNGALGYFEQEPYNIATMAVGGVIAEQARKRGVYGVIGGGETVQVMEIMGVLDDIDLVSTGGGAMLEYLAGKTLPGVAALQ